MGNVACASTSQYCRYPAAMPRANNHRAGTIPMPIPDERLPDYDEVDEESVNTSADMLDENDELEFESADADEAGDEILEPDEDTASFGYGDPVE